MASAGTWSFPAAARPSRTTSSSPPTSRWCRRSRMRDPRDQRQPPGGLAQHRPAAGGCRRRARRHRPHALRRAQGDPAVRRRRRRPGRPARGGAAVQGRARRGGRRADRDARVQLVDSGRAQERARLGVAAAGRVARAEQAGRGALVEHGHVRRRLGRGRDPQGARRARRPHARGHGRRREGARAARERRRRDAARRAAHRRRRTRGRRRARETTRAAA